MGELAGERGADWHADDVEAHRQHQDAGEPGRLGAALAQCDEGDVDRAGGEPDQHQCRGEARQAEKRGEREDGDGHDDHADGEHATLLPGDAAAAGGERAHNAGGTGEAPEQSGGGVPCPARAQRRDGDDRDQDGERAPGDVVQRVAKGERAQGAVAGEMHHAVGDVRQQAGTRARRRCDPTHGEQA